MAKEKTLQDVVDGLVEMLPEGSPDRKKLERMAESYDESGLAKFLNDRGQLPRELQRKYGLDKVGSWVAPTEIPEEAPEYTGDEGTAELAGMNLVPEAGTPAEEEPEEPDVDTVDDYNELTVKRLKAEVDRRNEERSEEFQIVVQGTAKQDYVNALEADDAEYEAE